MRSRTFTILAAALVIFSMGGSSHTALSVVAKLLTVDQSKPTRPAWTLVDGERHDVLPMGAFASGKISQPVRATKSGSLTGEVVVVLTTQAWNSGGAANTSAPVVKLIGDAGQPQGWERLPVRITHAVVRNADGSETKQPAEGWLLDAADEINGVRCSLERPAFSQGKAEPTVQTVAGHQVVVVMGKTLVL